jgi:hypothetical protein
MKTTRIASRENSDKSTSVAFHGLNQVNHRQISELLTINIIPNDDEQSNWQYIPILGEASARSHLVEGASLQSSGVNS